MTSAEVSCALCLGLTTNGTQNSPFWLKPRFRDVGSILESLRIEGLPGCLSPRTAIVNAKESSLVDMSDAGHFLSGFRGRKECVRSLYNVTFLTRTPRGEIDGMLPFNMWVRGSQVFVQEL
jgi:hypothetical protein